MDKANSFSIQVPVTRSGMSDCFALYSATLVWSVTPQGGVRWICEALGEHSFTKVARTPCKALGAIIEELADHYDSIPAVLPGKLARTLDDAQDAERQTRNACSMLSQAERDLYFHRAQRNVDRARFRARVQELRAEIASLKAKLEDHHG